MKTFILSLTLTLLTVAQSFAVSTNQTDECDSLKLSDGRIVAVQITKQTNDRIFFTLCEDKSGKEGVLLKRFVEAVIVNGRVTQEPAKSVKESSKENETLSTKKALKNGAIIAGIGAATYLVYKFGFRILKAIGNRILEALLKNIAIFGIG